MRQPARPPILSNLLALILESHARCLKEIHEFIENDKSIESAFQKKKIIQELTDSLLNHPAPKHLSSNPILDFGLEEYQANEASLLQSPYDLISHSIESLDLPDYFEDALWSFTPYRVCIEAPCLPDQTVVSNPEALLSQAIECAMESYQDLYRIHATLSQLKQKLFNHWSRLQV